jgi:arginyl-tRNA synthetase
MNVFQDFTDRIKKAAQLIVAEKNLSNAIDLDRIVVEPPREAGHGDLATNAAMILAKPLGEKPRDLASRIAAALARDPDIDSAEVAGPGFINLRLKAGYWHGALKALIAAGSAYGRADLGRGEKVNVEFVSTNPTGPLHVGHSRGAVIGDVLASLLAVAGYAVTREYYINDAGAQVDVLARSAYLRYREALGQSIGAIPEGLYPGSYLKPVGEKLAADHGDALLRLDQAEWLPIVRAAAIEAMMSLIRTDLQSISIGYDVFFSERSLVAGATDRVAKAIDALRAHGLIYSGTLPPPKGQSAEDWEDREQTLFRSTAFGDDMDRALLKSDGSYTYFASDIAYHYDKYLRGFRTMIDVWGADHSGHVKRMKSAVAALTGGEATLDIKLYQLVNLFRNGEPVKMSKRSGDLITLREVVEEVGADAIRFMMVFRKNDAPLDFDFEKVTEQSKDNPVFYVQYAHARAASVFRQVKAEMPGVPATPEAVQTAPLAALEDEGEMALIRRLCEYPRILESAAQTHEPHRIAFYLYDVASDFHAHWNRGKELPQLRFIHHADSKLTLARLALVHATKLVLSSGLAILGVSAPEEMR